ncbi:hypothetical protein D3228_01955 [Leucobacter luti]|nr:hypothetical protein [Leucobacter luti]
MTAPSAGVVDERPGRVEEPDLVGAADADRLAEQAGGLADQAHRVLVNNEVLSRRDHTAGRKAPAVVV